MSDKRANDLNLFTKDQDNYSIDTSKKLKVGIIGTGWIAESHISEYLKMPDVELVGVADLVDGKAEKFLRKWNAPEGVRVYHSHKELIDNEELDAVSVCTYNMTHAECTIYALDHGVNVLLEKPMCVTLEEAVEIRKAEKRNGKIVSVGFQPRYNPNMQMIKYIIESGELGKVYHIQIGGGRRRGIPTPFGTTFIEKETGGIGALGDIGCYALEGGLTIDFKTAWAMNVDTMGDTVVLGTKAGLKIPSSGHWGSIDAPLKIYRNIGDAEVETVVPMLEEPEEGVFYWKVRKFLDAVKEGGEAPVPTSQAIYNQAILDGIYRSAQIGHEIELEIPEV